MKKIIRLTESDLIRLVKRIVNEQHEDDKPELEEMDFKKAAAIGAMALSSLGNPNPALAAKNHDNSKHPIHQTVQHKNVVKDALSTGKFGGKLTGPKNWNWKVEKWRDDGWERRTAQIWVDADLKKVKIFSNDGFLRDFAKIKNKKSDETSGESTLVYVTLPNTLETVNFIRDYLKYVKSHSDGAH